jgi:hypothetical protein
MAEISGVAERDRRGMAAVSAGSRPLSADRTDQPRDLTADGVV